MTVVKIVRRHWHQDDYQDIRDEIKVVATGGLREGERSHKERSDGEDYLVIRREYGEVAQR